MKKLIVLVLALFVSQVAAEDLLQIYEMALESDPQLKAARSSRDSSAEAKPQAIADMLPQLALSGSVTRTDRDTPTSSETYDSSNVTVTLTQPLLHVDHWIELSKANYTIAKAKADYGTAELDLMVRVAKAYFNILATQDSRRFARAERKAISRQLEQAKQRFEVGLIAVTDVHEVQAAFDKSRADEITADNDVDSAWEALREIVADLPGKGLYGLRKHLPLSRPKPASMEVWTKTAMEQNPSVVAARNNMQVARKNISSKRSGHLPTLDLVAKHADDDTSLSSSTDTDTSSISLQLSLPIFSGGEVLSQTRQARYDFETASEQHEQTVRSIRRQVRDAYRGVVSSISRVEALRAATVSAQSALDATQAGFEVGTRTMVDVLDEQRNLYRARRDYAKARYDYIINGLLLKQAAGILSPQDIRMVNGLLSNG